VNKEYLSYADAVIESCDGDFTKFVANMSASLPNYVFQVDDDGNPTRESIALAIKADIDREHKGLVNGMNKLKTWAEFDFKAQTKRKGQFVPSALLPADVIKLVDQTLAG